MKLSDKLKSSVNRIISYILPSSLVSYNFIPTIQQQYPQTPSDAQLAERKTLKVSFKDYLDGLKSEDAIVAQKKKQSKKQSAHRKKNQKELISASKDPLFINDFGDQMSSIVKKSSNQNSQQQMSFLEESSISNIKKTKQTPNNKEKKKNQPKQEVKVIELGEICLQNFERSQRMFIKRSTDLSRSKNMKSQEPQALSEIIRKIKCNFDLKTTNNQSNSLSQSRKNNQYINYYNQDKNLK